MTRGDWSPYLRKPTSRYCVAYPPKDNTGGTLGGWTVRSWHRTRLGALRMQVHLNSLRKYSRYLSGFAPYQVLTAAELDATWAGFEARWKSGFDLDDEAELLAKGWVLDSRYMRDEALEIEVEVHDGPCTLCSDDEGDPDDG